MVGGVAEGAECDGNKYGGLNGVGGFSG